MVYCDTNTLRLPAFNPASEKGISSLDLIGLSPADSRHSEKADQLSDAEVIRRVLDGEVNSFEHLINRHRRRVFGIVSRHVPPNEVEELAHDVFIRAFKSLATFRNEGNFQHWLSSIAVRTCHDYWRNRYRSREIAISGLSQPHQKWLEHVIAEESSNSFTDDVNRKEAKEILKWALEQLQAKDKILLELLYFQGYSIKEAAKLLGWTQATVKVRSFRSRKKLQKILRDAMKPNSEVL